MLEPPAEVPMSDLLYQPLTRIVEMLARREMSAVELMQATLERIDATHEKLNAFVALRDRDALLADAAAPRRAARGCHRLG
jgi:amidase